MMDSAVREAVEGAARLASVRNNGPHIPRHYSASRTMPSDVHTSHAEAEIAAQKRDEIGQALGIVVGRLQAVEEAEELIARSITTGPAIQRGGPGEGLFLHRQGGLQIDLRRFHRFMPEP
jgi:integrase/recombinase XerD